MRTLLTVLACVVTGAVATAAPAPSPTAKTFDVAHLIGDDAPFATIEDLRKVVSVFLFCDGYGSEGCCVEIEPDSSTQLKVYGFHSTHDRAAKFLDTLHDVKRRRGMVVSTECLMLRMPAGGGDKLLLPQEHDRPLVLTEREFALTDKLIRHTKAEVHGREALELPHGREGSVVKYPLNYWGLPTCLDPRVSLKLKATISDDGKSVTLAGGLEQTNCADYVSRVTHAGKFKGGVPVGGTVVVKVSPKVTDGQPATDDELYVFVRVREVRPAVMPGGNSLPQLEPPPVNSTPKVEVPRVPPIAVPLPVILPVGGTTVEVPPVHKIASFDPLPLRNYWDDLGPLRPLPGGFSISHGSFNFYVGWIGGQ